MADALLDRIKEMIRAKGRLTFAEFMQMALYEPELGYYMSPTARSGREGDYFTAPELHPVFGRLVGEQLVEMAALLGDQAPVTIVEMGAGRGLLAHDVQAVLADRWPDERDRPVYVAVELGPHHEAEAVIRRCRTLAEAVPPGGLTGVIFSNELVDAFPVHRIVMRDGQLMERYVTLAGDRLADLVDQPSSPALADYFDRLGIELPDGYETEVNLRALDWMGEVGRALRRGFVLTIDYGHPAEERYATPRCFGTLAGYAGHRRIDNPYERIGHQDLTAHVDFSALVRAGRDAGLKLTGFTDQTGFLMGLGAAELLEARLARAEGVQREVELAATKMLLAADGMGRAFKVLIQHKGLGTPRLRGLSFRPFFHPASFGPDRPV
jgi:SAM-dependent MidA family methyltransferase